MKRLFLVISILLISCISCKDTVESTPEGEFPSWVKQRAEELSSKKGESCEYVWVIVFESQGKRYYNIDFAYSSCNNCNLYDEHGNRVSSSVFANNTETKIVDDRPACTFPK